MTEYKHDNVISLPPSTLLRNFCVSLHLINKEQNEGFFNPFDSAIKIKNRNQ